MSSTLLGRSIAAALLSADVTEVVCCPGSRNTSLILACSELDRIRLHPRIDERSGGFTALGLARACGAAAIVVTSGTAVGNLLPAVMEARASGVALIVITADRPATLIGTGANQTTRQAGIFSSHVLDEIHLASSDDAPRAWCAAVQRGVTRARGVRTREPGPVHINAAFTPPFVEEGTWPHPEPLRASAPEPASPLTLPGDNTVVLAGDADAATGAAARRIAEHADVPLLAEPTSNCRAGRCAIPGYRDLLDTDLGARVGRVVVYGHPTLSRPVSRLLARDDVEIVACGHRATWNDPGHAVNQVADTVRLSPAPPEWLAQWRERGTVAPVDAFTTRGVAAHVIGCDGNIVIGQSNVIRQADVAPITDTAATFWGNRGLAGIDGVCSTAAGIALGTKNPTTVLVGDISFLHDIGSLHIPPTAEAPNLRIVVCDDDGGAIFRHLEIGADPRVEPLFCMPHGRDLVAIAAGYGWPAVRVSSFDELERELAKPINKISVIVAAV